MGVYHVILYDFNFLSPRYLNRNYRILHKLSIGFGFHRKSLPTVHLDISLIFLNIRNTFTYSHKNSCGWESAISCFAAEN